MNRKKWIWIALLLAFVLWGASAQSIDELRKKAASGDAEAQFNLGVAYDKGKGVPQDQAEAVKWFRLAAEQGDANAQLVLGVAYYKGEGVPQDYAEAVKWYRLAAEQGDAWAQNNLGDVYAKGEGVQQNYVLAHMWFNLASMDKEVRDRAVEGRDMVAEKMTPAQIAEAQRLAAEWKPTK